MEKSNQKYEAVIGLEIHAELKTKSKMFCSCKNDPSNSEQNMNVCPVCLGMPGMLPVLNKQAIEWTILTGLALNCQIGHSLLSNLTLNHLEGDNRLTMIKWDRKNYFYPDLPKGYQISQYDLPLCHGGWFEVTNSYEKPHPTCQTAVVAGGLQSVTKSYDSKTTVSNQSQPIATNRNHSIGITRIHLEEDTGTSKHPEGRAEVDYSLMDYNRAGVPLMELVTEPDITSAQEAKEFCQKYQLILRYLGVADADMEKGQLRCEINISLREITRMDTNKKHESTPNKLGTKVEIKNLNSFKSVEKAIEYEIKRQSDILDRGEKIVQETRGWDDAKSKTYTMRVKETSADYRYFPEPDLPAIRLARGSTRTKDLSTLLETGADLRGQNSLIDIEEIRKQLPELPDEKLKKYVQEYKLREVDAEVIINDMGKSQYFEKCLSHIAYRISHIANLVNWIINETPDLSVKSEHLVELVSLIEENKITGKTAKEILPEIKKGKSPSEIIKEKGLEQIIDERAIEKIVDQILSKNSEIVEKIRSGQTQVMGFLVGQVMRESKGQANPQLVNEILKKKIK